MPLLIRIFFTASLLYLVAPSSLPADERPNIVLILANDLGRDWVSCYGASHQTPNVDRLATQGVRYETAWCTPIGTSTRVTLLTGQYPFRHGWTRHYNATDAGGVGLSWAKFKIFARVLRESGYATAVGGSWQVNHLANQPDAVKLHGFDEHCVWTETQSEHTETGDQNRKRLLVINGLRDTTPYDPNKIQSFLTEFITREREAPFLVYYPMLLPNDPDFAAEPDIAASRNTDPEREVEPHLYAQQVTRMDQIVGALINSIDKAGLRRNTLIIFTSDNGSATAGILHNKPYAKGKSERADRGAHVPFIVRAPFLTRGGRASRDLIDFTDLYTTVLDLAKIDPPHGIVLDGRSFVPSLRGSEDPFEKRNWIFSQIGDFRMLRDWHHILDSDGSFHDLTKDPLQQSSVSPLDKIAPGRRQRLQMILERFPENTPAPFAASEPNIDR